MQFTFCLKYMQSKLQHDAQPQEVVIFMTDALTILNSNVNTVYYAIALFRRYKEAMVSKYGQQDHLSRGNMLQFAIMIILATKVQEDRYFNIEKRILDTLKESSGRFCWVSKHVLCSMEHAICAFLEYRLIVSLSDFDRNKRRIQEWYEDNQEHNIKTMYYVR